MQLDIRRLSSYSIANKGDLLQSGASSDRLNELAHIVVTDCVISVMTRAQSRMMIASIPRIGMDTSALARISHGGSLGWFVDSGLLVGDSSGYSLWSVRPHRLAVLTAVSRIETATSHMNPLGASMQAVPPSPWSKVASPMPGPLITLSADYVGMAWRLTKSVLQVSRPFGLQSITDHKYRPGNRRGRASGASSKLHRRYTHAQPRPSTPGKHVLLGFRVSGAEICNFEVRLWRTLLAPTLSTASPDTPSNPQEATSGRHSPPVGLRLALKRASASLALSKVQLKHSSLPRLVDHGLLLLSPVDPFTAHLGPAWVCHDAKMTANEVELRLVAVPWAERGIELSDERQRVRTAMWDGRPVVRLTGVSLASKQSRTPGFSAEGVPPMNVVGSNHEFHQNGQSKAASPSRLSRFTSSADSISN